MHWRTLKKYMVYWFFWSPASSTTYISLYSSCSQIFLDCYTPIKNAVGTILSSRMLLVCQLWSQHCWWCFFIRVNPFDLISWFDRVFSIISEMLTIPVCHVCHAKWYTFYYFYIVGIRQNLNCLWVPSSRIWVDKRVHYKVQVKVMLVFICWSRASGCEP